MSIFNRLFGRRATAAKAPEPIDYDEARNIVADFGEHLEAKPVAPGTVRDCSELPHPKELIQSAFERLFADGVDPEWREALKIAYVALASWQNGVGPSTVGLDASKMNLDADPRELARAILARQSVGKEVLAASETEWRKRTEDVERLQW